MILSQTQVVFGLPPPFWLSDSFRGVVGQRQSELAIQSGQLFSPQQALSIGLVKFLFS
jgi:enoyl-CoA hydratase/carnithine racemase